jgi:hypothetical protein
MICWLRNFVARIEKLLRPKQESGNRSRLLGMYLSQANQSAGMRSAVGQQRQDGKFAQNRRRG